MHMKNIFITTALFSLLSFSCKKDNETSTTNSNTGGTTTVPDVFKKIYGASDMYVEGNYVVIKTTSLPDHKSPYYLGTQWESTRYEAYNGSSAFIINPNRISQQSLTFKIPITPVKAATSQSTPGGPIGVSLNGVPFFNQYAAMGAPLTNEIISFDQYAGHPQQQGQYHYHIEPVYLTNTKGKEALLGFLLDGYPVYGPTENGKTISNADLDAYHGHTTVTPDYPNGIYHYHTTAASPYINGSGFYGVAGTVSQ
jgi:YHYH protein